MNFNFDRLGFSILAVIRYPTSDNASIFMDDEFERQTTKDKYWGYSLWF